MWFPQDLLKHDRAKPVRRLAELSKARFGKVPSEGIVSEIGCPVLDDKRFILFSPYLFGPYCSEILILGPRALRL